MNPLGMVVALLGAMDHAATLNSANQADINRFTGHCKEAMYAAFREGRGTRDLSGPSGLTTEGFVDSVGADLAARMASGAAAVPYVEPAEGKKERKRRHVSKEKVDEEAMKKFFDSFDVNGDGSISFEEFVEMAQELNIAPKVE